MRLTITSDDKTFIIIVDSLNTPTKTTTTDVKSPEQLQSNIIMLVRATQRFFCARTKLIHRDYQVTMSQQLLLFVLTLSGYAWWVKVDSFSTTTTITIGSSSSPRSCRSIIGWKVIAMTSSHPML